MDYFFELKNIDDIKKLEDYYFIYTSAYDAYIKYYDTGISVIRFIVYKDNKRKGKLYVDSNMCEFFTKDRILRLLTYLNIEDLFKEVKE